MATKKKKTTRKAAARIPEMIPLNDVELHRQRDRRNPKKWSNEWVCEKNWNTLYRNKKGLWQFDGGPLKYAFGFDGWYCSPEEAYVACMDHILKRMAEEHEKDAAIVMEARNNVSEESL